MGRILTAVAVNTGALAVAAWLFPGIRVGGDGIGERLVTLLAVAVIFGLVNAVVAPVVKVLSLPLIVLTLGLALLAVNALLLLLVAGIAGGVEVPFDVAGFWTAVGGALVVSVVAWALQLALRED